MNQKNRNLLDEVLEQFLREDERVELACLANVGTVSAKRQITTAAVVGIASAGMLMVAVRPVTRYVVLTNQRLLLLAGSASGKPTSTLVGELPRRLLSSTDYKSHLKVTFHIVIEGAPNTLKMEFPFPLRNDARQLADALAAGTTPSHDSG